MDVATSFAIIALAALLHASFQLSVSMVTLLSGHAIGAKSSHARVMRLTGGFLAGVLTMTTLLLSSLGFLFTRWFGGHVPPIAWAASAGLMIGVGLAVWSFYYRREAGTALWLPRGMAHYLTERTKATKNSAESFTLGLGSVIAEILFIIAPIIVSSLALVGLGSGWQLLGVLLYVVVSAFSLITVVMLIGGGHKISHIQRWRESNKRFLQFAAGSGLFILGCFIYVTTVALATTGGGNIWVP